MEEYVNIIEKFINVCNEDLYTEISIKCDGHTRNAIENLLDGYKELDKDNNDLRRLYRRTAIKLKEKGHEELADYFLAQINEVPTFVVEDDIDYYSEYHRLLKENQMLRGQLNDAFDRGFIHKSVIQNKKKELEYQTLYINGITDKTETQIASLGALIGKIQVLQELLEERNK